MKKKVFVLVWALALLCTQSFASSINWEKGYIEAKGLGAPPAGKHGAQGKILARRAAIVDGYRNLGELIQGVHVSSETVVKDFVVESDVIRTKVEALVKGAQIVDEKPNTDGSYEVTLRIFLAGKEGINKVLIKEARKKEVQQYEQKKKPLPPPLVQPKKIYPDPDKYEKEYAPSGNYTGLIIDARNLGVQPAMSPKLLSESGDVVYGVLKIEGDELAQLVNEKGIIGYASSMNKAKASWRSGSHPLIIKGKTISGHFKADVTVSDEDAKRIKKENEKTAFLQHLRVTILY